MRTLTLTLLALTGCAALDAPSVTLGPEGATTTDPLELVLEHPEPLHEDAIVRVRWTVDGAEVPDLADALTVPVDRTVRGQTWTAEAWVERGNRNALTGEASLVVQNTPPDLALTVGPKGARTDDDLVATVEVSDADQDAIDLTYTWSHGTRSVQTDGPTLPAAETSRDETWTLTVRAEDEAGAVVDASAGRLVQNTPPSVALSRVSPASVYTGTRPSCQGALWIDPDDDPETYEVEWFVNGVSQGVSDTLDPSTFERGDDLVCSLTPVDPVSTGEAVASPATTVRNTPPRILGHAIANEAPTTEDRLTATFDGRADDDGDFVVIRYSWRIDGEVVSEADFLPAGIARKGDEVVLVGRPFDGRDTGGAFRDAVTIENAAPTAPDIAITGSASTGLTCTITAEGTDADGDPLSYSVDWSLGIAPWDGPTTTDTHPGDTIPPREVAPGDRWSCTVHALDDEASSAPAIDTVDLPM